jgi:hypothetical protein
MSETDYLKYRGRCREMSEALVKADPTLTLVRGHYVCPMWGRQQHWWCKRPNGEIVDPTVGQFPTRGVAAEYVEFDGRVDCGEEGHEGKFRIDGRYAFCSTECNMRFVGL